MMMFNVILIISIVTMLLIAGRVMIKQRLQQWYVYIIKAGNHYCRFTWNRLLFTTDSYLAFNIVFGGGCDYALASIEDQSDINKLYGLGYGWRGPSYNSYRIGWRWGDKSKNIEVFLFVQEQRLMWYDLLGAVTIGEQSTIRMMVEFGVLTVYFYQDQQPTVTMRYKFKNKISRLKYRCLPYFGGNQVSPHDVKIMIKEII